MDCSVLAWLASMSVWLAGTTQPSAGESLKPLPADDCLATHSIDWNRPSPDKPPDRLPPLARSITVRVMAGRNSGSGILIQRQGSLYSLITNHHVLTPGKPFRVQAPDGRVYPATLLAGHHFWRLERLLGHDLEILQFRSQSQYAIASLNPAVPLKVGSEVYAAGFPFEANEGNRTGFVITPGHISLLLERSLSGGYQIGYTNRVHQGMSGGPLLNREGEVVGVNGLHAYPLWGDPYTFQDGSSPLPPLKQAIAASSWAIPIATVICFAPLHQMSLATPVKRTELCHRKERKKKDEG